MHRRAAACLLFAAIAVPATAQIPETFENLQLLDADMSREQLIGIMRNWTSGLGVRCNHCHVGPDNLVGADFASDEKATKRTARRMLEMVRAINGELLANLPVVAEGDRHQVVSCFTCHRGMAHPPRDIVVELGDIAAADGVDAALDAYDRLRDEHYGSGVYDFTPSALARAARYLVEAGSPADAVKTLEKSLEHHPEEADTWAMIGMIHLQSGDAAAARAALEKALELDPENRSAQRAIGMLDAAPDQR